MTTRNSDPHRTIAQVNRMIRSILEAETLEHVFWAGGRIDRFHKSDRGHVYFDLVDDRSRIRCMIREERAGRFPFDLRNHLDIEVYGDIHFYEERAEPQINVVDLRVVDESADTTPIIDRLRAQGLYPHEKRKPPAHIHRIGVITSQSSRAIGDFESAYQSAGERRVLVPVVWKYVILEGSRAAQSILDAIHDLDKRPDVDVIAVVRGGGRSQNLEVLDTFEIARAVIRCRTYLITGIGHHKDSTLTDEVADYAASTPTAVAQFLADLSLRPPPSSNTALPRPSGFTAAKSVPRYEMKSRDIPARNNEPSLLDRQESVAKPPRFPSMLIFILLVMAVASVALLIAAMLTQLPG